MSTFYKYAERNVADRVDWSTINKNFTGMLKDEATLREKKKADIEKATEDTLQTLADNPTGLDRGVNENILNYSAQGQEYLLMMNRLLKSGQLDPKDYSIYTQNLKTDTNKIFQTTKTYQENYTKDVERAKTGTSSEQEVYLRSLVENAANFSKSQFYINNNGRVTVGLPQIDPATGQYVLNKDQNTYNTIDTLKYASTVQLDKYDVDTNVKNIVDSFGKEIFASAKLEGRVIRTIEDIRTRKGFEVMEQNYIDSLLVNPNSSASILTDWIKSKANKDGKIVVYGFSNNPDDPQVKSGEKILMIADPVNPTSGVLTPQLTPEQKKEAENFLRDRVRAGLDYEAKSQYFEAPQPREFEYDRADKKKAGVDAVNMLGTLYYGDEAALAAAGDYFKGLNKDIMKLRRTPNGIQLVYKDGTESTISFKTPSGELKTQEEFIKSATELSGNADVSTALSRGGYRKGAFSQATAESVRTTTSTGNPLADFKKYVDTNINKSIVQKDQDTTASNLSAQYNKFGYEFEATGNPNLPFGDNYVTISTNDGKIKAEYKIDANISKNISGFMKKHAATNIKTIGTVISMGELQGTTGELD